MEISDIIIDPEFRDKIPAQTPEEFEGLKADILRDGYVRDPLTVWKEENILLDGHHRWDVITENWELLHDQFTIDYRSLPNRWAAIAWICANQLHRHNMNDYQRASLIQEEHDATAKAYGASDGFRGNQHTVVSDENHLLAEKNPTRKAIAKEHGITEYQVQSDVEFGRGLNKADKIVPGFKQEVFSGETKVTKREVAALRKLPDEEIPAAVEAIKNPNRVTFPSGNVSKPKKLSPAAQEIAENDKRTTDKNAVVVYGIDDLLEDLRMLQNDFIDKYHHAIDLHMDVATDNGKKVLALMKEFETEWKEIKERVR